MALVPSLQQTVKKNVSAGFGQFSSVRYRGQVFTATQSRVDAILFYCQFDGGGTVGFKVYFANVNQTTNLPTSDIYSFTIPASSYTQNKFNRFLLPTPITSLTVGQKYCVYFAPWNTITNTYQDYYRDLKWSSNDAHFSGKAIRNNNGVWSTETNLQLYFQLFYKFSLPTFIPDYSQPPLPQPSTGLNFNGIDMQVTSKHWDQDQTKITNEVNAVIALSPNYLSIGCPYDNPTHYKMWCDTIHNAGKSVNHRGHFNGWEGDNEFTVHVSASEYQTRFYKFVQENPTCFWSGDKVTMCCEANRADNAGNTAFRTSGSFDYAKYNDFQIKQVSVANKAFLDAGITGIHTWPISHSLSNLNLHGQVLDSGDSGNPNGLNSSDIAQYFQNRLSIDHYLSDSYRQSNSNYAVKYTNDLNKIHTAYPNAVIDICEMGYHPTTNVSDQEQQYWYDSMLRCIATLPFVIGWSMWNHMGQTQSSLFTDTGGNINTPGRPATNAIKAAFESIGLPRGW